MASSSLTDISPFISGRWLEALSGYPKHKVGGSRESTSGLCPSLARDRMGNLGGDMDQADWDLLRGRGGPPLHPVVI